MDCWMGMATSVQTQFLFLEFGITRLVKNGVTEYGERDNERLN